MATVSATPTPEFVDQELVAASIPDATGVMWVTPELAALWLQRNSGNRKIKQAMVNQFARDMAMEHWSFTGETIKFSVTGRLIDGQHRLLAVVKSGATIKVLVVVGVPDESQAMMDAGAKRSASDALEFKGEVNTTCLASTVRFAITLERKAVKHKNGISTAEIMEWLAHHPDIRRYVGKAQRNASKVDLRPSVFAYALWRVAAIDEDQAQEFFTDIVEMRSSGTGDPVNTLLQRMRMARRARESVSSAAQLGWIFRAWNARRAGVPLKRLSIPANDFDIPPIR